MEVSPPWKKPAAQLLKNFATFMEPRISLLCSQEPSTGPYPEPDESSHYDSILFL
jgi:hypothetical protein